MSLNIITVTLNMGEASAEALGVVWGPLRPVGVPWERGGGSSVPGGPGWGCSPPPLTERHHFLGISIVGQSNDRGDGGIYIGSIMKGGAVAADGRIEPGDMLLQVWGVGSAGRVLRGQRPPPTTLKPCPHQVNDVNFENMSNDDAVRVLREIVSQTG